MAGWYSLWTTEEQIEIPKLESDPLSRLSEELVGANERLGIGARIGGRQDDARLLLGRVHEEAAGCVGQWGADLVLAVVDESVASAEEIRRRVVLVRVETERHGPVEGYAASRRDRTAVPSAERGVDQLSRLRWHHLRVHVHVFVRAPVTKSLISHTRTLLVFSYLDKVLKIMKRDWFFNLNHWVETLYMVSDSWRNLIRS